LAGVPDTASHWDDFLYDSSTGDYIFSDDSPCIPEPSTLLLFGVGALGFIGYGWRRWKQNRKEK